MGHMMDTRLGQRGNDQDTCIASDSAAANATWRRSAFQSKPVGAHRMQRCNPAGMGAVGKTTKSQVPQYTRYCSRALSVVAGY